MKHKTLFYALTFMVGTMLWMGCRGKAVTADGPEQAEKAPPAEIVGQITEIDDHSNAVTDIEPAQFTALGWDLKDTIAVEFENWQKISGLYVTDYGDVPIGDYLVRFSGSRGVLKIAINEGYLAEALKLKSPGKVVLRRTQIHSGDL